MRDFCCQFPATRPFLVGCLMALLVVMGCNQNNSPIAEEAPCLPSTAWREDGISLARSEMADGSGLLFITRQTYDQNDEDSLDGTVDYSPHDRVYSFDAVGTKEFRLVDDNRWDEAQGLVYERDGGLYDTLFTVSGAPGRSPLVYNGRNVGVVGGTAVTAIQPGLVDDEFPPFVAVISATGTRGISFFLFQPSVNGEYYHQLFSEASGQPLGPAIPLPFGRLDYPIRGKWVANNQYVIWESGSRDNLCVIDVQEWIE